jgi:TRAP-type C4-dicarboxylate transport system substrate-binding protein
VRDQSRRLVWALAALALPALLPARAVAAPLMLRIATAAPDGSAWAREFRAFSRDVEAHTQGEVQVKWYFGAIAGDDFEVMARVERGQIDGVASGGGLCQKLSPTLRAMRVQDLLQSHPEATWLTGRVNQTLADEFLEHQLVYFGGPVLGVELVFSRAQIGSWRALQQQRLWRWDMEPAAIALSRAAGMTIVPRALGELLYAADRGDLDGFIAVPSTMLAFQLLPKIHFVQDWPHGFLIGCFMIAQRAFDRLSFDQQQTIRADATKAILRVDDVARDTDARLLGGLLQRQGITVEATPPDLKRELQAAMREAPKRVSEPAISSEIVRHLRELLVEHRKSR